MGFRVCGTTVVDADLGLLPEARDQAIVDRILRSVQLARPQMSRVIVVTATYTIPKFRLNQWLAQTRVGPTLNFKSLFVNELPGEAERKEVWREIDEAPGGINGIVDLASGTVVAISPRESRRRLSHPPRYRHLDRRRSFHVFRHRYGQGLSCRRFSGIHAVDTASPSMHCRLLVTILFAFVGGASLHFIVNLLKARQGTGGDLSGPPLMTGSCGSTPGR